MTVPALVAVDWGTSSFRAYLLDRRGTIVDRRSSPVGILQVQDGAFEAVLEQEIGPWLAAHGSDLPVIASGMIGSRQGWVEVPYLPCPCHPGDIAQALLLHTTSRGRRIRFVPGLMVDADMPDVMRGEETEIVGAAQDHPDAPVFLLPGSHSKWVRMEAGRILRFATFMTGEIFAVLRAHSILGRLMQGEGLDDDAFDRGAVLGLADDPSKGGLLHRLFSTRTLPLTGRLAPEAVSSYLSGLLIGTEVAEVRGLAGLRREAPPVVMVGGSDLVGRYVRVFGTAGIEALSAEPHAAARGLFAIAQAAGMLD